MVERVHWKGEMLDWATKSCWEKPWGSKVDGARAEYDVFEGWNVEGQIVANAAVGYKGHEGRL